MPHRRAENRPSDRPVSNQFRDETISRMKLEPENATALRPTNLASGEQSGSFPRQTVSKAYYRCCIQTTDSAHRTRPSKTTRGLCAIVSKGTLNEPTGGVYDSDHLRPDLNMTNLYKRLEYDGRMSLLRTASDEHTGVARRQHAAQTRAEPAPSSSDGREFCFLLKVPPEEDSVPTAVVEILLTTRLPPGRRVLSGM
jgi:hypothetical protein